MAVAKLSGMESDIRDIEQQIRAEIQRLKLRPEDLAKKLNIFPSGAMAMLKRDMWSLDTILRLASLLKMEVRVSIGKRT